MPSNRKLFLNLSVAYRSISSQVKNSHLVKGRYSTLTLLILLYVEQRPHVSQGELGKILYRDPMTMSQAIRSLQQGGLLTSRADKEDRRVKRLSITKKGSNLSRAIRENENQAMQRIAKQWGRSNLNQFLRNIGNFNDQMGKIL